MGSRFTGGSDETAGVTQLRCPAARQIGPKRKGSRVAGLLPSYDGWSHPIASPRLSIKTGAPRLHRLSHMDERTVTTRAQPANTTLVLTLTAFLRAAATHRHKPCTTCDAAPKQALCLSRRGTTATSTDRGGTGSGENEAQQLLTCDLVFGPIFAGKFQFSGTSPGGRWTRKDHEEIEVHGGTDCLHPAAG